MTIFSNGPVILVGCGRLGSAMVEGWLATGAVDPRDLIILTPSDKPAAETARAAGARINPPAEALSGARAVVLAVKPAKWRDAAADLALKIGDAPVISVMAGVRGADLAAAFAGPVARVMPTTGVAVGRGAAGLWSADAAAAAVARSLFAPVATVVDIPDEAMMDAVTAMAGSGPAYVFAFTRALAQAGEAQGLPPAVAADLARATVRSAAAGLDGSETVETLIARVASPGGTTEAGLKALTDAGLDAAVAMAVAAAKARAEELSR